MAALISANINFVLAFLPPVLWLIFYLREDRHPEPKLLLLLTFIGGMASAFLAMAVELFLLGKEGIVVNILKMSRNPLLFFLIIGLVEEYVKYLPVKILVVRKPDFDEPVDAMIYMMTAALGFAAVENFLFGFPFFFEILGNVISVLPLTPDNVFLGIDVATNRFLGANLLHALSSGVVGFFLARAWFSPNRHHFIALGIVVASVLHAGFNYLILKREIIPQGVFFVILLLATMAVMVFIDFERLKRTRTSNEYKPNPNE